ncbi:MAG: LytR family transcriptional regulator [Anaerolineae bacterium]|nr:MAG: LytR family transcriptional regulator [Anaerolineae bacterium]
MQEDLDKTQPARRRRERRRTAPPDKMLYIIGGAFAVAGLITAVLLFQFVKGIVSSWSVTTDLPGIAVSGGGQPGGTPGAEGAQPEILPPSNELEARPWDGASRVTMLIMGLDLRDWEAGQGAPRTDTMVLLTIDPATKTAGMMSIPRDLWVNIPGYGYSRINAAYQFGEGSQLPGGGPGLAVRTVEEFLGIEINYYAVVDFDAFVTFIDLIGGVEIDVPERIRVDIIDKDKSILIREGRQTLPGQWALAYARARNSENGDFDRALRTQLVILGIRQRILDYPTEIVFEKGPEIWNTIISGVKTNITFDKAFELGLLAMQVDIQNIKRGVIGPPDMVTFATSPDGTQQVLKPITQNIRLLRDEIFSSGALIGPGAVGAAPVDLMVAEAATVALYNGSPTAGLAGDTQTYLVAQGVNIVEVGNAEQTTYTTIIDYTGKPYTIQFLVDLLGIQNTRIFNRFDPDSAVDVEIILGSDWQIP